jgi:hypothetical protein
MDGVQNCDSYVHFMGYHEINKLMNNIDKVK